MSTTNGNGKSKRSKTAVQELENLPTVEEMLGQTPPATSEETTPETLVTNEQPTQPEKAPVDGAGRKGEEAGEQGVGRRGEKELMNNSSLPSPQLPSATGTPSSSSPPPPAQSSSASSSPTAEELLRQAKAQTKEKPQEEQPQQAEETTAEAGALAETATDVATGAIAHTAQDLVKASLEAQQEQMQIGLQQGLEAAKNINTGYQLGLLIGTQQSIVNNTKELGEQLQLLTQHTNAQNVDAVKKIVKAVKGEDKENTDPLAKLKDITTKALPQTKLSLFGKQ